MKLEPKYLESHADDWPLEYYGESTGKTKHEIMAASCLTVVSVVPYSSTCSRLFSSSGNVKITFCYLFLSSSKSVQPIGNAIAFTIWNGHILHYPQTENSFWYSCIIPWIWFEEERARLLTEEHSGSMRDHRHDLKQEGCQQDVRKLFSTWWHCQSLCGSGNAYLVQLHWVP